jgi:hypothetical protein
LNLVVTSIATDEELLFSLKYILHQKVTTCNLYHHLTSSSSKLHHCRNYFLVYQHNNINYYQSSSEFLVMTVILGVSSSWLKGHL